LNLSLYKDRWHCTDVSWHSRSATLAPHWIVLYLLDLIKLTLIKENLHFNHVASQLPVPVGTPYCVACGHIHNKKA